ncbi:MAG: hypothetical protein KGL39_49890 [Patescibacteria group bacterium]|nr:hypothetical protein [Patescibacteria group bacterium]
MNLELAAMRWLWLEKKCHYIVEQRTPRHGMGQPDVIGVTKDRYLVEVEIKRSVSDFRADRAKNHRQNSSNGFHLVKYFYYLMPYKVFEKVELEIPEWAGVLTLGEDQIMPVVKCRAPSLTGKKLSLKECAKMARAIVNHSMTTRIQLERAKQRFRDGDVEPCAWLWDQSLGSYQI